MMDRWRIRLLSATVFIAFTGRAQLVPPSPPNNQPPQLVTVTGTVYDSVSNAPIGHVLVQLPGRPNGSAFSDSNGRFEIPGVPAGQVNFTVEKPGYFSPQTLEQGAPWMDTSLTVDQDHKDVRLKLIPEAHIEGRIVNSDNEPVSRVMVTVFGDQIVEGRKRETSAGVNTTNAAGRFQIDGLRPGRYYLRTAARRMFQSAGANSGVNIGYPERFYPSAPDRSSAQPIVLKAGETAHADMQLTPERFHQISGTVSGAAPGDNVFVNIGAEFGGGPAGAVNPKTGRFQISLVFPGVWKLTAQVMRRPMDASYGEEEVSITDSDVNNVQIEMHPGVNIPMLVDMPPSSGIQSPENWVPQIRLIPVEDGPRRQEFWPQMDESTGQPSRFFANVRPGSYRISISPMGGMCVDSITSGSTDLVQSVLNVQAGVPPQAIHVVMGSSCAKLTGTVSDNDSDSSNGDSRGVVVLVPVSAPASSEVLNIQPDKSFSAEGLAPGDYKVFAVNDLTGLEYANPKAMATISGQEIHLDANQTAHVNVELNRREPE